MDRRIHAINRFTVGWTAYFALADGERPFHDLDEWLRSRLRQVRWKEWKRGPTRARNLRSLGVPAGKAHEWANTSKGPWRIAGSWILTTHPDQGLLARPRPARIHRSLPPFPGRNANRRMRTRMSGGVGGAGVSPAPTRFRGTLSRCSTDLPAAADHIADQAWNSGGPWRHRVAVISIAPTRVLCHGASPRPATPSRRAGKDHHSLRPRPSATVATTPGPRATRCAAAIDPYRASPRRSATRNRASHTRPASLSPTTAHRNAPAPDRGRSVRPESERPSSETPDARSGRPPAVLVRQRSSGRRSLCEGER